MDGNLAPNAGAEWYEEPTEQRDLEREELIKRYDPQTVLANIHDWFKDEAEKCDHISFINLDHPTMSAQAQIAARQELKNLLLMKQDEFKEFEGKI